MLWLNKTKNWIIAHKNWLILMGMFILSYVLGKKANKNYYEMAKLAKDQYKKDNDALIREQKMKELRDNTAKRKAAKAQKALEEEKDRRLQDLENRNTDIDSVFQDLGIKKK